MVKSISRYLTLVLLNMFVIIYSTDIDVDQLINDFSRITWLKEIQLQSLYLIISTCVSLLSILLLVFFKPFIEIYLIYYFKFSFYFMINLLSLSSVYIVFRIYGYSRLYLLVYLVISSLILYLTDKIEY